MLVVMSLKTLEGFLKGQLPHNDSFNMIMKVDINDAKPM